MTRNDRPTTETVDENWVAYMRDLSTGVVPPTPANPHAMSRVAIRRTRTRRAVLATGGGVMTVAAVTATAFAIGGPTTGGVLLPGGSASASASADLSAEELRAEELRAKELRDRARAALESASDYVPIGWQVHELEGLTYALPDAIVSSGPSHDERGVTSDMWHNSADPDAPPFLRIAYVTPDYEFYDTTASGLTQTPGPDARPFELPGSTVATIEDGEELSEIAGAPRASAGEFVRILVHRADGPGRYIITMTLPGGSEEYAKDFDEKFVAEFQASLNLG